MGRVIVENLFVFVIFKDVIFFYIKYKYFGELKKKIEIVSDGFKRVMYIIIIYFDVIAL